MKQKTRWHDALVLAAVLCAAFLIVTGTQQITGRIDGVASMVFVLAVFLISVYTDGYVWGVVASLIGVLAVNFAFRSPYFAFNFTLPENLFSGMAMLVVSIMTSTLTTRIKKQEQLRMESETEKMRANLLRAVSHDLRTPLTLIKGYAETVRDITGDDKAHRDEQMNIIVDEADRLTALVSSVMELSKVTSGAEKCEKVHFDMGQLCDEVSERYDAVCAQNGWQLKLELPEEELPVYADPNMMQRALHNLLGNAMHHIGGDGIFLLRAAKVPEGVRVEIEDHGPGICAEDLPYIFDRYYRSRSDAGKQGTGLGLSITKAIFQQHGFRFGVQSTLGKGTTFWFIATDTK